MSWPISARGETFSLPVAEPHPLKLSADMVTVVLLVFFADATWSLWRRGDRGRALGTGGSLILFLLVAGIYGPLVDVGAIESPLLISFTFLVVVLAMAAELTRDVVRAGKLSAEIKTNERRWRTLTDHVHLLVLGLDRNRRINYVDPFVCDVTGYSSEELLGREFGELSRRERACTSPI